MSDLVEIDRGVTYVDAGQRARELAQQFNTEVAIRRSGEGWAVLVPSWVKLWLEGDRRDREFDAAYPPSERVSCSYCSGFGQGPTGDTCPRCSGEGETWL